MKKTKKILTGFLGVALIAGMTSLTGCGGVSEEQMAQLTTLRAEVKSLEKEVNSLKSEKAKLERQIAERNAKLEQCNHSKKLIQNNLKKMKK